jgi:CheY-like chemotaxis protein
MTLWRLLSPSGVATSRALVNVSGVDSAQYAVPSLIWAQETYHQRSECANTSNIPSECTISARETPHEGLGAASREVHNPNSVAQLRRTRARVLVVEDDVEVRLVLADILGMQGYEVVGVENGLEALGYLRNAPSPSVILLDLMMPVMSGWEFCDIVQHDDQLPVVPIVILTAAGNGPLEIDGLGARAELRKPVDLVELLSVIGTCCHEPSAPKTFRSPS